MQEEEVLSLVRGDAPSSLAEGESALVQAGEAFIEVSGIFSRATQKMIARCFEAGLTRKEVIRCAHLASQYQTDLWWIARWIRGGMKLQEIDDCLRYRTQFREAGVEVSVSQLHKYLRGIGETDLAAYTVLDLIYDIWNQIRSRKVPNFPANQLFHILEERFDGDILRLYHMWMDDERRTLAVLLGRQTMEGFALQWFEERDTDCMDERDEEAYEWAEEMGRMRVGLEQLSARRP